MTAERMSSATVFASGPTSPSGPTHDGHPDSHGHDAIRSRVLASSAWRIVKSGSDRPMPPG